MTIPVKTNKIFDKKDLSYDARVRQIKKNIPSIFSTTGKILYVGVSANRTSFLELLNPKQITILEIHKPNIEAIRQDTKYSKCKFVLGDVRCLATYFEPNSFSVAIWYHGPEHVTYEKIPNTLNQLETIATQLVVLGCPWGIYKQGEVEGNIHEIHQASLYPDDFAKWGYNVETLAQKDIQGSNILAWKHQTPIQ
jgi:hypothetical protein